MRRTILLAVGLGWPASGGAQAGLHAVPDTYQALPRVPDAVIVGEYRDALTAIRKAALRQQAMDGGRLSHDHSAAVEAQVDAATRRYRQELRHNDPSVGVPNSNIPRPHA